MQQDCNMLKRSSDFFLEQFEQLYKQGIHVYPLRNVKHKNNSKNNFTYNRCWINKHGNVISGVPRNKKQYCYDTTKKYIIENHICGGWIPVYPLNDICVIDNDDNKDNKKVFDKDLQQRIHNLCDNDKKNCITSTPSGGTHTIFKHHDGIIYDTCFNGCVDRLAYNFDKTKNPCCIFVGWREDGQYICNYNEPQPLNPDMLEIFKTKPENVKNYYKHNKYVQDDLVNTKCRYDPNLKIDFKPEKVIEILKRFNDPDFKAFIDSKEWFKLTSICKTYSDQLDNVKDLWEKISKNGDKYNKEKNDIIWNDIEFCKLDINYIVYLHNRLFFKKSEQIPYFKRTMVYKPLTEEAYDEIKYVDLKYCSSKPDDIIQYNLLETDNDLRSVVLKSGMNTGKSTAVFKHIWDSKENTISVNSNKALNREHKNTLINTYGEANVFVLNSDKDNSDDFQKLKKRLKENNNNVHIVICINSIYKLLYIWNDIAWNNTTLFLDEFRDSLTYLYTSSTLYRNRLKVIQAFKKVIGEVYRFFVCDGNITDNELDFLNVLDVRYNIIINTYKSFDCPMYVLEHEAIYKKMKEKIKEGKKIMICSDTKKEIQAVEAYVKQEYIDTGILKKEEVLLLYCGSEDSYTSSDNLKDLKVFGFSPTIKCGIDYREKACVFGFIKNKDTLTPELIAQQIARCRNPEELNIYIANVPDKPLLTSDFPYYVANAIKCETDNYESIIDELCDKQIIKGNCAKRHNEETFMLCKILFHNDIQKSNYNENLFNILEKTGYKLQNAHKTLIKKCVKSKETIEDVASSQYSQMTVDEAVQNNKKLIETFDDDKYRDIGYDDYGNDKETLLDHYTPNEKHSIQMIRDMFHINPFHIKDINEVGYTGHLALVLGDNARLTEHLSIRKLSISLPTLLEKIKTNKKDDLQYNTMKNDQYNIIYILKKFMIDHLKHCFVEEQFETFNFDAKKRKNHETISVNVESYRFLKGFIPKSKCDLPKTRYDVMKFSMKILKLLCPNITVEERKQIRVDGKQVNVRNVKINLKYYQNELDLWRLKDTLTEYRSYQRMKINNLSSTIINDQEITFQELQAKFD